MSPAPRLRSLPPTGSRKRPSPLWVARLYLQTPRNRACWTGLEYRVGHPVTLLHARRVPDRGPAPRRSQARRAVRCECERGRSTRPRHVQTSRLSRFLVDLDRLCKSNLVIHSIHQRVVIPLIGREIPQTRKSARSRQLRLQTALARIDALCIPFRTGKFGRLGLLSTLGQHGEFELNRCRNDV